MKSQDGEESKVAAREKGTQGRTREEKTRWENNNSAERNSSAGEKSSPEEMTTCGCDAVE